MKFSSCLVLLLGIFSKSLGKNPNLIVIMADDLGYGDLGCYGADPNKLKTPNIDRLAKEGLKFTSGYCSASTCTPTRYSFLTGTYAFRGINTGIAPPSSPLIIPEDTYTLPDILKQAGYKTAVIGKWHLGLGALGEGPQWNDLLKPGPLEIGFDYSFLLPTTNDRVPQVYVENHKVLNLDPRDPLWVGMKPPSPDHPTGVTHRDTLKMDWTHGHNHTIHNGISRIGYYTGGHRARFRDEDLADKWVEKSKKWIGENKKDPFFLFFASHDLHVPRIPHERFRGTSTMSYRGDVIVQLDWCVGEIVKCLKKEGLEKDTMIIFCSDNGPVGDDGYADEALEKMGDHQAAGPFSGGKYSIFEGGTRTPFITYWPGTIRPGISENVVCTIDFAGSFAKHLGVKLPEDACLDSLDVMNALLGKKKAKGRSHLIVQDNGRGNNYGYRAGDWKLHRHDSMKTNNFQVNKLLGEQRGQKVPQFALFDLAQDPAERNNLAKKNPKILKKMKGELQNFIENGRSR